MKALLGIGPSTDIENDEKSPCIAADGKIPFEKIVVLMVGIRCNDTFHSDTVRTIICCDLEKRREFYLATRNLGCIIKKKFDYLVQIT